MSILHKLLISAGQFWPLLATAGTLPLCFLLPTLHYRVQQLVGKTKKRRPEERPDKHWPIGRVIANARRIQAAADQSIRTVANSIDPFPNRYLRYSKK